MAKICLECMGRRFVYSPGGYAPKLPCPICHGSPKRLMGREFFAEGRDIFSASEGGAMVIARAADAGLAHLIAQALSRVPAENGASSPSEARASAETPDEPIPTAGDAQRKSENVTLPKPQPGWAWVLQPTSEGWWADPLPPEAGEA